MDSEDRSMLFLLCCLFGGLGFLTVKLLKLTWEVAKWTGDKLWIAVKWTGVNLRKGYKVLKKKWNKRQERKALAKEKQDLSQETDKVPLLKDEQVPELQPIWTVAKQQNPVGVSDKQVDDKKSMKDATTGAVKTSIDTKNRLTNGFQINNGRSGIAHQI